MLCLLTSTHEKKTFASFQDNYPSDPDSLGSQSFSSGNTLNNQNGFHHKSRPKTERDLFDKFNPNERSILDFISTTEFDSNHQLIDANSNQGDNPYSLILESLTPYESKNRETQIDYLVSFQDQFQRDFNNRILQSQSDLIYLGENVEGEFILENEGISSGELENGEGEFPVEESGETEGGEDEGNEDGGTEENNEGSWLDGEVCFEALLPSEEVSIVESQQSRRMKSNTLETQRLLSLIDIDININIEIEIERIQPQEEEEEETEENKAFAVTITATNPGGQTCQTERICRVTTIPRLGKRCLCRQIVVCSF